MKRKVGKLILVFFIILSFGTTGFATSIEDLTQKQNELQNQKDEATQALEGVKTNISETMEDLQELSEKIIQHEAEAEKLELEIDELITDIQEKTINLEASQKNYDEQKALLEKRLIVLYEAGETSYLDVLLHSSSLSDFISNYYMMTEMARYDTELLENIEQATNLIEAEKEALETQKSKLVALQEENDKKIAMVSNMKVLKTNYINQLTEEEKALQADIEVFNQEMAQIESDLINLTDSNSAYAGGEMAWPAPGYYTITSPFGYRVHPILGVTRFHSGVDIGVPTGGKVIAANDGIVIKTTYTSSYGNMVMIDHGGGIVTLYAHGSKIIATLGQEVKRGDVIMEAGSTGWSTGPHLHFEVRLDGEYQQPLDELSAFRNFAAHSSRQSKEKVKELLQIKRIKSIGSYLKRQNRFEDIANKLCKLATEIVAATK